MHGGKEKKKKSKTRGQNQKIFSSEGHSNSKIHMETICPPSPF